MPATTKARAPRAKAVSAAVTEATKPVRKPRAKKATPVMASIAHEKVAVPKVARALSFSSGYMAFSRALDVARDSVLSMAAAAALMSAMTAGVKRHSGNTAGHRRSGSRAHRTWARRRAAGHA